MFSSRNNAVCIYCFLRTQKRLLCSDCESVRLTFEWWDNGHCCTWRFTYAVLLIWQSVSVVARVFNFFKALDGRSKMLQPPMWMSFSTLCCVTAVRFCRSTSECPLAIQLECCQDSPVSLVLSPGLDSATVHCKLPPYSAPQCEREELFSCRDGVSAKPTHAHARAGTPTPKT